MIYVFEWFITDDKLVHQFENGYTFARVWVMFHVYMLDSKGYPKLLEICIDEERVYTSVDLWSNMYPHAIIDYVYKDTD